MAAAHHPTDDMLSDYGLGKLAGRESETVEGHITTCHDCRRRVAELSSDGFLDRLQRAAQPEGPDGFEASRPMVEKSTVFVANDSDIPPVLLTLEQYSEIRRLGHGGMGEVFLAKNARMDREEVLKVMSKTMLERTGAVARFEREIRSVGKLNHPNIVTTYAAQQVGDTVVLSMENAGEDMAKLVEKRGPLPVSRACYFVHQAALGLQYAHEKGLVHRDIKPSNLMVLQNGSKWQVKILDFGLAKSRVDPNAPTADLEEHAHHTKTGQSLGTPSYMAPEQYRNAKAVDIRADIYALGCTLHFLLTGRPPFVEEHPMALMFAHAEKVPEPVRGRRADVPAALDELIATLLAKDPKDRLQTPAELAKALVTFIKPPSKPPAKSASSGLDDTSLPDGTEPSKADGSEAVPPKRKRWPAVALGLVALAIVGLAVGSLFIKTERGTIVLEDVPADAEVTVDGKAVTVARNGDKATITIDRDGIYAVVVRDGTEVMAKDVTVKVGGEPVRVRFEKPKKPVGPGDPDGPVGPVPPVESPRFVPLFDGRSLSGLRTTENQKGTWTIDGGVLVGQGAKGTKPGQDPGLMAVLESAKAYGDFVLRIEKAAVDTADRSIPILVRVQAPGSYTVGYSVSGGGYSRKGSWHSPGLIRKRTQLNAADEGDDDEEPTPGSSVKPILKKSYVIEIAAVGNRITTSVDGTKVDEIVDASPAPGRILLRARKGTNVRYKRIEIRELPPKDEFTPLFNGKDLTGFETSGLGLGNWTVANGILTGRFLKKGEGGTILIWPKNLAPRHYHLRLVAKKSETWDSPISLFCDMKYVANNKNPNAWPWGGPGPGRFIVFTGTTSNQPDREVGRLEYATGNSRASAPLANVGPPIANNEWYTMDIVVLGQRVTVDVNGVRRADYTDPDLPPEGRPFTFGCPGGATTSFKSIEFKELPAPEKKVEAIPAKVPIDGRMAAVGNGHWRIEGDVLKQTGEAKGPAGLIFGDARWSDYDYSLDVRWQTSAAQIVYRAASLREKSLAFVRGKSDNAGQSLIGLETHDPSGDRQTDKPFGSKVVLRDWNTIKVSVRSNQATIFVNGQEACAVRGIRHASGRVGVRTFDGTAEFRNIRVTDPAGKLLWEGLPDLPAP